MSLLTCPVLPCLYYAHVMCLFLATHYKHYYVTCGRTAGFAFINVCNRNASITAVQYCKPVELQAIANHNSKHQSS